MNNGKTELKLRDQDLLVLAEQVISQSGGASSTVWRLFVV